MRRQHAFTLIELLVVIAVIALLLAILMPSLQKAKKMAQATVCQSNVKQWGLVFQFYADDNEGKLPQSIAGGTGSGFSHSGHSGTFSPAIMPTTPFFGYV